MNKATNAKPPKKRKRRTRPPGRYTAKVVFWTEPEQVEALYEAADSTHRGNVSEWLREVIAEKLNEARKQ